MPLMAERQVSCACTVLKCDGALMQTGVWNNEAHLRQLRRRLSDHMLANPSMADFHPGYFWDEGVETPGTHADKCDRVAEPGFFFDHMCLQVRIDGTAVQQLHTVL